MDVSDDVVSNFERVGGGIYFGYVFWFYFRVWSPAGGEKQLAVFVGFRKSCKRVTDDAAVSFQPTGNDSKVHLWASHDA